jgi:hypothetical protein
VKGGKRFNQQRLRLARGAQSPSASEPGVWPRG